MNHKHILKTCPFCGNEVELIYDNIWKDWRISCLKTLCRTNFSHFDSKEEAIILWNTRYNK